MTHRFTLVIDSNSDSDSDSEKDSTSDDEFIVGSRLSQSFKIEKRKRKRQRKKRKLEFRKRIPFLHLPGDVLKMICSYLEYKQLCRIEICNLQLFFIAHDCNSNFELNLKYLNKIKSLQQFRKIQKIVMDGKNIIDAKNKRYFYTFRYSVFSPFIITLCYVFQLQFVIK